MVINIFLLIQDWIIVLILQSVQKSNFYRYGYYSYVGTASFYVLTLFGNNNNRKYLPRYIDKSPNIFRK